jgi:outer membrane protein assembly factor BamB
MYSYRGIKIILITMIFLLGACFGFLSFQYYNEPVVQIIQQEAPKDTLSKSPVDSIEIFMQTFLGNETRNFYGDSIPSSLDVLWKFEIGGGETNPTGKEVEKWYGAGWTGEPLIVKENGYPYLIQGCYDHTLKKIDALTGLLVWSYAYDDVLKGTGTIWIDPNPVHPLDRILILQGARIGPENNLRTDTIPSYRAISYFTGKEVWRLNVKKGPSFSRDVDGSALIINDTVYIGLENGFFSIFTAGTKDLLPAKDKMFKPLLHEYPMFEAQDKIHHGGELVIEASPCRIGDHVYVTTGSGHLYGFSLATMSIDFDLFLGCDMNGSPVVTADSCLIITLEKQFIEGRGGAMKIDPSKPVNESIIWYFPTEDREFASWKGGIVGSVSVNDYYKNEFDRSLACISALDGNLYLVDHKKLNDTLKVKGPDNKTEYPTPVLLSMEKIGPTISTPIFINGKICAAGYAGIHIFEIIEGYKLNKIASFKTGIFEATPTAYNGRIFIASKGGFLYCFGKDTTTVIPTSQDSVQ